MDFLCDLVQSDMLIDSYNTQNSSPKLDFHKVWLMRLRCRIRNETFSSFLGTEQL